MLGRDLVLVPGWHASLLKSVEKYMTFKLLPLGVPKVRTQKLFDSQFISLFYFPVAGTCLLFGRVVCEILAILSSKILCLKTGGPLEIYFPIPHTFTFFLMVPGTQDLVLAKQVWCHRALSPALSYLSELTLWC